MLLIFLISIANANINMLTYDNPGTYKLMSSDYEFSAEIIVEIWGAGGGGCSYYGGSGGSYIKALIKTFNQTFNLVVGKGGKGGSLCLGTDGESSVFSNDKFAYLTAGGGRTGPESSTMIISPDVIVYKKNQDNRVCRLLAIWVNILLELVEEVMVL